MEPATTHVFIAGIGNSGLGHWQSMWRERVGNGVWVEHDSWDDPVRNVWVKDLDEALSGIEGPKVLIAHSLGCALVTEWAGEHEDDAIVGAFLVSIPDVHGSQFPAEAVGFDTPRYAPLPFPTLVIASENDPYGSPEHSLAVAERLGARLVSIGRKGHINADSDVGDWPEGWALFRDQFER